MSLNIEVNSDYKITSDSLNVIVNRKCIVDPTKSPNWPKRQAEGADPTPREEWREVAYFTSVKGAVEWIADQKIRASDAQSIRELIGEIKRIQREIDEVLTV